MSYFQCKKSGRPQTQVELYKLSVLGKHILCLNETWLPDDIPNKELSLKILPSIEMIEKLIIARQSTKNFSLRLETYLIKE